MLLKQIWSLSGVAALGVALAGCQHAPRATPDLLQVSKNEPSVQLSSPQVADMQVAVARTLEQRGETEPAMQAYTESLKHDPRRVDAHTRMAILLTQQGKFTEAVESYRKAYELQPHNPDLFCDLGYTYYLQGNWSAAEKVLKGCLTMKPDHQRAHNNLGLVFARSGNNAEALQEFRQAGCTEADARINLAHALALNKNLPEAQRIYEEALALQPSSVPAKTGLANVTTVAAKLAKDQAASPNNIQQVSAVVPAAAAKPINDAPAPPAVQPAIWRTSK